MLSLSSYNKYKIKYTKSAWSLYSVGDLDNKTCYIREHFEYIKSVNTSEIYEFQNTNKFKIIINK